MNRIITAFAVSLALGAGAVVAGDGTSHEAHGHGSAGSSTAVAQAAGDPMSEGEVRKVDKEAGKITLKHGEIKNLSMPPMTMVFRVKDPSLLDKVQAGAKVRFHAEQEAGAMTVTAIEPVK